MLTIIIPVKNPFNIKLFIEKNVEILRKHKVIVIDSGGGEMLKPYATTYINRVMNLTDARKLGYQLVDTKYIMNLDSDVMVPEGYIEKAIKLLNGKVYAVSIFYENVVHCQGALEYGISIWNAEFLKEMYDFSFEKVSSEIIKVGPQKYSSLINGWCECNYMWRKIKTAGGKLETLPIRAIHLKECI